jgi:AcrR family transcriptional regulator
MGKGETTRQSILERATALTSQVGLAGLTIGGLAEELGLSKSGLFAHFKSKEALEVQVLEYATELFVEQVLKPALKAPRGEPRLRALFERSLDWQERCGLPGGCPILAAAHELDDKPGPARDKLVSSQKDWLDAVANLVRAAIAEGHFQKRIEPEQFAFELLGIETAYQHMSRLLEDPAARRRARSAFEALLARAKS